MTDTNEISGTIQPKATAFDLEVSVPKADMEFQFTDYWNQVKDRLTPELVKKAQKGGFRDVKRDRVEKAAGGKAEFYRPVLIKFVSDFLDKQPKQAIAYNEVSLHEGIASNVIKASVYLEPEVTWKTMPGVAEPLVVKIPKLAPDLKEKVVEAELKRVQGDNVILTPEPEGTATALGHVVALDCETVVDGIPWAPGTFTNNKWWLDTSMFKIKEMLPHLLNLTTGESNTFTIAYPEGFGDVAGKSGAVRVRINQIYKRETPEIDDDLAITHGKASLAAWKIELEAQFDKNLAAERSNVILMGAIAKLVTPEAIDVEPIPYVWLVNKANTLYTQNRNAVRTEDDLLERFKGITTIDGHPVIDKNAMLVFFGEKAAQSLIADLVIRSWGQKKGVAGDTKISSMDQYVEAVQKVLVETAQIEEVEVNAAV